MDRREDKPTKKIELNTFSDPGSTPASEYHEHVLTPIAITPVATPGTGYQFPTTPVSLSHNSSTPISTESTRWGTPKASESKHSETPTQTRSVRKSRWDLTPSTERGTPKVQPTPEPYQSTPGLSTPAKKENDKYLVPMEKGETGSYILREMQDIFVDECPTKATIYRWIRRFDNGDEELHDVPRPGCPTSSIICSNIVRIQTILDEDRRIALRELEERVG
ncbi:Histone-lysine N-methyltransferase SETMAR-like [Oopsacas minuta]|uniref:Histone-lysine N-methyltransferase SETMAR-like n=1 Tax=Oopsacas minuta TaxID=111878 RepID=A0AAV7JTT9_9METZ|nr:Histone-lysine N-methyltransferase SETMAR-like [Oopsacas minuta]